MKDTLLYVIDPDDVAQVEILKQLVTDFSDSHEIYVYGLDEKQNKSINKHNSFHHLKEDMKLLEYFLSCADNIVLGKNVEEHLLNAHRRANIIDLTQYRNFEQGSYDYKTIKRLLNEIIFPEKSPFMIIVDSFLELEKDKNGLQYLIEELNIRDYTCMIFALNGASVGTAPNSDFMFYLHSSKSFLQDIFYHFNGTIIYQSAFVRDCWKRYVKQNKISFSPDVELLAEKVNLLALSDDLENDVKELSDKNNPLNKTKKYRDLLMKQYEVNECSKYKISIIIPRYNTPLDLTFRAIGSSLDCGHENVEVIVIDDGSKDNIESDIKVRFNNDKRVYYYYKENEGLGLTRNYGIRKSTGDYIFYLDSDDTIQKNGLPLMLAHMIKFNLKYVCGKRVLCDETGKPINESVNVLYGNTYRIYYRSDAYLDQMVNNKLISRDLITENDIWFETGVYEDVLYTAKLYQTVAECHQINVHVHNWYQYGKDTTLSSIVSYANFEEKMHRLEEAWHYIPDETRKNYIKKVLLVDFQRYYREFYAYNHEEQQDIFNEISSFVYNRKEYISYSMYDISGKEHIKCLTERDYDGFKNYLKKYRIAYSDEDNVSQKHNVFVASTHYHLLVSIAYALSSSIPSKLYIYTHYNNISKETINKLEKTGVFEKVMVLEIPNLTGLIVNLETRPQDAETIIPTYLYNHYDSLFRGVKKEDDIYIFSDTLPDWYYLERKFDSFIKLEDAYNSFDREVNSHEIHGRWAVIEKFAGSFYPPIFFESDKIKKIICSSRIDNVDDVYKSRIVINDTKNVIYENKDKIEDVMMSIYEIDKSLFSKDSVLVLTQPLELYRYCTKEEQKALYEKMCSKYPKKDIIIKPHPADLLEYDSIGATVISKDMPIEILNLLDVEIDTVISFGSSANETIEIARNNITLFPLHGFGHRDVVKAINNYIPKNTLKRVKKQLKSRMKKIKSKLN